MLDFHSDWIAYHHIPSSWATSGSTASVALQGDALLVVFDPQHSALLCTRRLRRTSGQDHPDLPAVHVQVFPLPHIHVLRVTAVREKKKENALRYTLKGNKLWVLMCLTRCVRRIRLCLTAGKGILLPSRLHAVRRSPSHRALSKTNNLNIKKKNISCRWMNTRRTIHLKMMGNTWML